ncbi:MAG: aminotransferase class III-fold pyridoxal phosphate-dependent enzyme, partial [Phyllobacterium sp.]|nr:aminotransferase class III-fold pyridoxal phosphate-dependent enzyme [Phyllobacterium sp.]
MTSALLSSPVWHPFTQHALEPAMKRIVRTEGAWLFDAQGNAILDAISSWWVITHGHRHPLIMEAIRTACDSYDQIIFAEFTHEPAEKLARGLLAVAPAGLAHVFYSDSGSTCVEVALKMALGFFHNTGAPRSRIVVMEDGYHGDTIGTMSAGERGVFNAAYQSLLFSVDRLPFPSPGHEQATLDEFERLCRSGQVAALLVEPLVLGAGGMRMYPAFVLAELKRIADRHGTLLIADEVMTGRGRTGTRFACTQ